MQHEFVESELGDDVLTEHVMTTLDGIFSKTKQQMKELLIEIQSQERIALLERLASVVNLPTVVGEPMRKRGRYYEGPEISIDILEVQESALSDEQKKLNAKLIKMTLASIKNADLNPCFLCHHCRKRRCFLFNPRQWRAEGKRTHMQYINAFTDAASLNESGNLQNGTYDKTLEGYFLCGICVANNRSMESSQIKKAYEMYCELVGIVVDETIKSKL